jgi:hypothetical protein
MLPSFRVDTSDAQVPGALPGTAITHLPNDVASVYEEARASMSVGSHTAAVLALRKMLMHVAVDCGAKPGMSFVEYVTYLADNHYVPPRATAWLDRIRTRGNEANHQIVLMTEPDAKERLTFSEMLLRLVYEYPASASAPPAATP